MTDQIWLKAGAVLVLCSAMATALPAQTFTSLFSFDSSDGSQPVASMFQGTDAELYGTTAFVGQNGGGTIFKISTDGVLTTLYGFCLLPVCADGAYPIGGLLQATSGDFYGTTQAGGSNSLSGTVFKFSLAGELTTLYNFCAQSDCDDGQSPYAGLIQDGHGNFFGTTLRGGTDGSGTLFKITSSGAFTQLYNFGVGGSSPVADLVQVTSGDLFGTASHGGSTNYCQGCGSIFKTTPGGSVATIYSFCSLKGCPDGRAPAGGLLLANDGNFYGTTLHGGMNGTCPDGGCGTLFKVTPSGTLTTLYSFCSLTNCADGANPQARLVEGTDGNFYGTTTSGGANRYYGTVFKITPSGTLTTLYSFCQKAACTDGEEPLGLMQASNGVFYGTTSGGGVSLYGNGTVFSLDTGLGPFVRLQPAIGAPETVVGILGNNLESAGSVSFNGIEAEFEVVSNTLITAVVPAQATSGNVAVVTHSGTLLSNVPFRVQN